ncbi:MFS transporter [Achromobacter xylosoxidans]|uniref:MFS transporter n=1 Tax=Alcaligenes xylosoxydans xylosoxydans TaxID=85698 RepID=A0A424W6Y1_ALCXX|nr:MFS transporter [Achromobacter xylosoxidans]MBC9907035.1 MFS transporter [Achromobacter xylosoxidans]MBD0871865.1 MFS transporter [Achromobacter xylosoxidans]QNP83718.1 MFS transporter [Achromobacter xylosoxidans]RPJ89039.1 MFS transporter [Achromobacter xylosoxidans]
MNLHAQHGASAIFQGWRVVAAAFAITLLGFGSAYSFSAFVDALQRDFSATRGAVSLVFSLAGFLYFGFGVVSGPLADRYGSRRMAWIGMLLVALGLALASAAQSMMQIYLAYGLGVGLGVGCAYVPVVGAVQRWFLRRRGLASGLAVSGIGVGTLLVPPLASALIDLWGWRAAYLALAAAVAVLGCAAARWVENSPQDRGLQPDGDAAPPVRAAPASAPAGVPVLAAIRSRVFLLLYLAAMAGAFGVFVPFVHLIPYALDHGIAPGRAVLLLGMVGVGSAAGRFLLGSLADRLGRRASLATMYGGMAASLALWGACGQFWTLALFALVFGAFYGGWVALMPAVVMDYFGGRHVSGIIGALYTSVAFGTLIGPVAAGHAYDLSGSYLLPIVASAAGNALAAAITALLPRQRATQAMPRRVLL